MPHELGEAYGRLGSQDRAEESLVEFAPPPTAKPGTLSLGSILLQLAEVVVRMRVGGRGITPPVADQIATGPENDPARDDEVTARDTACSTVVDGYAWTTYLSSDLA